MEARNDQRALWRAGPSDYKREGTPKERASRLEEEGGNKRPGERQNVNAN